METVFDLPAHPLMVHFPAVAIPILAVAAAIVVFFPKQRKHYGTALVVLAVLTVIATFMAARSGSALAEGLNYPDSQIGDHRDLGNMLRWLVLGLAAFLIGLIAYADTPRGASLPSQAVMALKGLVVVFAALSLVWAIRTGHEGAKSVWAETGAFLQESTVEATATTAAPATTTASTAAPSTVAPTTTAAAPSTTVTETTAAPTTEATTTVAPTTTEATTTTTDDAPETTEGTTGGEGEGEGTETGTIDAAAVFVATCARCHGEDGTGNPPRPALIGVAAEEPDRAVHIELVTNGGRFMPSFAEDLTAEEIEAVVDYVRETFVETP